MHQSLHHLVANAPWSDEALLEKVRQSVLPTMKRNGPIVAWIVDDTGFPKKGTHSVGVMRQYCGQVGKQENCRIAVSLSLPPNRPVCRSRGVCTCQRLGLRIVSDAEKTGIPQEIAFATKPAIALRQIRKAVEEEVTAAPVLADAAYGNDSQFREGLTELGLEYVVGVQKSTTVWRSWRSSAAREAWKGRGRPPKLLRRDKKHQPISVKQLALVLGSKAWKLFPGAREPNKNSVPALRHCVFVRLIGIIGEANCLAEEWLLIEWPTEESEPTKYWLATLPADTELRRW